MEIAYTLIRSRRKTIAIQITPRREVLVRCPLRLSGKQVRDFVEEKRPWIEKQLQRLSSVPVQPVLTEARLKELGEALAPQLEERIGYYASVLGVSCGRVSIRRQRTRWGSCSAKGSLSFNCLLALAPPEVLDYVVVHELCHRIHMDHSSAFWTEVGRILPGYEGPRAWLKENGTGLMARLPRS